MSRTFSPVPPAERAKTMRAARNSKRGIHAVPSYAVFKTAIGWCGLVMAERKLRRVFIGYNRPHWLKRHIRDIFGNDIGLNCSVAMRMIVQKLKRCCSGEKVY